MGKEKTSVGNETLLKITKEIVVKFIEMGKVTPASFDETFRTVYSAIESVAKKREGHQG